MFPSLFVVIHFEGSSFLTGILERFVSRPRHTCRLSSRFPSGKLSALRHPIFTIWMRAQGTGHQEPSALRHAILTHLAGCGTFNSHRARARSVKPMCSLLKSRISLQISLATAGWNPKGSQKASGALICLGRAHCTALGVSVLEKRWRNSPWSSSSFLPNVVCLPMLFSMAWTQLVCTETW